MRSAYGVSLGLLLVACNAETETVESASPALYPTSIVREPYAGEETQGVGLVSSEGEIASVILPDGGSVFQGALVLPPGFHGELNAETRPYGAQIALRIDDIQPLRDYQGPDADWHELRRTHGDDTFLYKVSAKWEPGTGNWKPLCRPDRFGDQRAVPVEAVWNKSGDMTTQQGRFTFACLSGAIAKCYKWNYLPWPDPNRPEWTREIHWACTRAARADYCGDGSSFTRDDTPVDIFDDSWPRRARKESALPKSVHFEAAWDSRGAYCLHHERWPSFLTDVELPSPGGSADRCVRVRRPVLNDGEVNICGDAAVAARMPRGLVSANEHVFIKSTYDPMPLPGWPPAEP